MMGLEKGAVVTLVEERVVVCWASCTMRSTTASHKTGTLRRGTVGGTCWVVVVVVAVVEDRVVVDDVTDVEVSVAVVKGLVVSVTVVDDSVVKVLVVSVAVVDDMDVKVLVVSVAVVDDMVVVDTVTVVSVWIVSVVVVVVGVQVPHVPGHDTRAASPAALG